MLALKDLNNPYALDKIVVELSRKRRRFYVILCIWLLSGKAILEKEGQLFFLKCEEADAPTGTMVQGNTARLITELPEKEQQEIRQIYAS